MKIDFREKLVLFSFVGLTSIMFVGYTVYKSNQKLYDSQQWVQHTENIILQSDNILSLCKDVETTSRGFVITNDSEFVKPLHSAEKVAFVYIAHLRQLTEDNSLQQKRVDSLGTYMRKLLDFSFQMIALRSRPEWESSIANTFTKQGKRYSDHIRKIIQSIQSDEGVLLNARKKTNEESISTYNWLSVGIFVLLVTLTILLLWATGKNWTQGQEREERAAELIIANMELAFQNREKENRAEELAIANKELIFQNEEKEKRAAELIIANKELAFQNEEKEKRARELAIANKELEFQNTEKEKRAQELIITNSDLEKTESYLKEYILGLEEMMFIISHKVRQPVAHLLGIANLFDHVMNSPTELKQLVNYIKQSTQSLDRFTQELTIFMNDLDQRGKDNRWNQNSMMA